MPPSTRSVGMVMPASASAASTRSAPRWATPSSTARTMWPPAGAAGDAEQGAAGAVVPVGRAEPEQGGHVDHAVGVGARRGDVVGRRPRVGDDAEVVAQPLHVGAGRQHDRLEAPGRARRRGARRRSGTCRRRPGRRTTGRSGPTHEVEHAAGAEGDLGQAGRDAALADERRLLVADDAGRSAARRASAVASPTGPLESTSGGHGRERGCAALEHGVVPAGGVGGEQAGDAGVADVGDVDRALGEVPDDPGVDRADAQVAAARRGRPRRAGGRPWWPTGWGRGGGPRPASTRQSPTVRRSCQPRPGPTGSPVARSHTMVEARWLAMPTPSTGPASASAAAGHGEGGVGHRRGVELDEARARGSTAAPRGRCSATTVASGRTTAARTPRRADVDDEDAHRSSSRGRPLRPPLQHRHVGRRWCRATRTAGRRRRSPTGLGDGRGADDGVDDLGADEGEQPGQRAVRERRGAAAGGRRRTPASDAGEEHDDDASRRAMAVSSNTVRCSTAAGQGEEQAGDGARHDGAAVEGAHRAAPGAGTRARHGAERRREPELARVEDAVGVEGLLQRRRARRSAVAERLGARSGPGSGRRRGGG